MKTNAQIAATAELRTSMAGINSSYHEAMERAFAGPWANYQGQAAKAADAYKTARDAAEAKCSLAYRG